MAVNLGGFQMLFCSLFLDASGWLPFRSVSIVLVEHTVRQNASEEQEGRGRGSRAAKHVQRIERGYSKAIAFLDCRCSVPLQSSLPTSTHVCTLLFYPHMALRSDH